MPGYNKKFQSKQPFQKSFAPPVVDQEPIDEEDLKWNPSPEILADYFRRDQELCASNLRLVMRDRESVSLRELKESTLHSSHTVEAQVLAWLKDGTLVHPKGKGTLALRGR